MRLKQSLVQIGEFWEKLIWCLSSLSLAVWVGWRSLMNLAFTVVRSHPKLTFSEAAQLKSVLSKLLSLWRALANTEGGLASTFDSIQCQPVKRFSGYFYFSLFAYSFTNSCFLLSHYLGCLRWSWLVKVPWSDRLESITYLQPIRLVIGSSEVKRDPCQSNFMNALLRDFDNLATRDIMH